MWGDIRYRFQKILHKEQKGQNVVTESYNKKLNTLNIALQGTNYFLKHGEIYTNILLLIFEIKLNGL